MEKDIKQANVCLGALIGPSSESESKAIDMFSCMIGGGMSFPLFQEVRNKRGLCYCVNSSLSSWSDCGIFSIYVGTDVDRVNEAIECIKDVVLKNKDNQVLLDKTKKSLLGKNSINFCSPGYVVMRSAEDIIFSGKPRSPQEIEEEIKSINLSEITAAVDKYLNPDDFIFSFVVPKGAKIKI
jgi:predicted Zn-dependent peptidase